MIDRRDEEEELGIVPAHERVSVGSGLWRGHLQVNLPVVLLMAAGGTIILGGGAIVAQSDEFHLGMPGTVLAVVASMALSPIGLPWIWWSVSVPKWRIWALRHVDNWPEMEARAVKTGLIWPRGWIFEKTEIKSGKQRVLEQNLIRYRDEHG